MRSYRTPVKQWDSRDPNPTEWATEGFDVSAYASSQFRVLFRFDSADGVHNDYLGWYIDAMLVTSPEHQGAFKTIVNAFANVLGWADRLEAWLSGAGDYIDVAAIDHYPQTWSADACWNWAPLDTLISQIISHQKEGAVMETGYSSFGLDPLFVNHNQAAQATWVDCALSVMHNELLSHNTVYPDQPIILSNWYELIDADTDGGGWPLVENHFGLLTSHDPWQEKDAYDNFQQALVDYEF